MTGTAAATINRFALIGSASGWGAYVRTTEKGPDFLQNFGLMQRLQVNHLDAYWAAMVYPLKNSREISLPYGESTLAMILPQIASLSQAVINAVYANEFPVVIGGDHVMAVGSVSGIVKALNAQQRFGLIWIDAHMDAHTPETTPSHAYHGMPLAALLGYGIKDLTDLISPGPKLRPENVVLIGVRSYEEEEAKLLQDLNVKVFFSEDVKQRGFQPILEEALTIATHNTIGFGVSIDLDAFDPSEAPGVGSPALNGLKSAEVLPFLSYIRKHPLFRMLEIAEFNPDLDHDHLTVNLIQQLLKQLLPQRG